MNKIVACVGLAALGASSMNAVAQDLGAPAGKPWNVSLSLRGFYDDNINTTHANKVDSLGVQISPIVSVNWTHQATSIIASYMYTLNYYDERPAGQTSNFDHTHNFNMALNHSFSERYQIGVSDAFVIGQEPDSIRSSGAPLATNQRIPGDNIRNFGSVVFTGQLTPVFGTEVGYANSYVNYEGTFNSVLNGGAFTPVIASPSGALDRMEHYGHIDARWTVKPTTVALVGYMYGQTVYDGNEPIAGINDGSGTPGGVILPVFSSQRDSRSHIGYAGVEHMFRPDLRGSLRAGAQYSSFYNDPQETTSLSPYVRASLSYTYAPESSVTAGFSMQQSATDVTGASAVDFVRNANTTSLYASLVHRIVPKLFGTVLGSFQNSTFVGGSLDGEADQYFMLGLNLKYVFNRYVSTEVGYNYDRTESDTQARQYDRNRVYIGVTGAY